MPAHWPPWPENTNASLGSFLCAIVAVKVSGSTSPSANLRSLSSTSFAFSTDNRQQMRIMAATSKGRIGNIVKRMLECHSRSRHAATPAFATNRGWLR